MVNPVLVEITRGPLVESVHRGSVAIARPSGKRVLAIGDVQTPIFPRSAIKAFQAIPFLETGAADRFGFGAEEIALACASHSGSDRHVATAARVIERIGLSPSALGCGAHDPLGPAAQRALIRRSMEPGSLHNNCSGKHAAMIATAIHGREPIDSYLEIKHPVQQRIAGVLAEFAGEGFDPARVGIDGCSAPNWAMPLGALASAFAQFVTGQGAAAGHREACERILAACWAEPELVAGVGRLDTKLMSALPGQVFVKTGAEGVYCGGVPSLGVGFALKIDDGGKRGAEATVSALVARLVPAASVFGTSEPVTNWRGTAVGMIRIAPALSDALAAMRV